MLVHHPLTATKRDQNVTIFRTRVYIALRRCVNTFSLATQIPENLKIELAPYMEKSVLFLEQIAL